jgi:NADH:ubiquinone oxidoreductase subunit 5 (subunit L)/multisubunit Na+/H+ antiporter MnhA subunit
VFTAGLTAFYMTRMFVTVFLGSERIEPGDEGHGGDDHGHGHDHAHGHGHGHKHFHVHPELRICNVPLVILAVASALGGVVAFTLPRHIYPVTVATVPSTDVRAFQAVAPPAGGAPADDGHGHAPGENPHGDAPATNAPTTNAPANAPAAGHGATAPTDAAGHEAPSGPSAEVGHATGGEEHGGGGHDAPPRAYEFPNFSDPNVLIPTACGLLAGLIGLLWAFFGVGPEKFARGWSPAAERLMGAPHAAYEGTLHAIFVRGGTKISELMYLGIDRAIDWLVNGVAAVVDYFAESLRTLQTGYVRNYALVMLAGAVFVVACFMIILQHTPR